ncbi:MAG: hypothetical protein Q4E53_05760 [Eubacteriales bacterium]|nr:hypothetical protein [Eubacteriales bacterium]
MHVFYQRDSNVHGIGTKPVIDWLKAQEYIAENLETIVKEKS